MAEREEAPDRDRAMPDANQQREQVVPDDSQEGPGQQGIHGSTSGGTGMAGMEPSPSSSGEPGGPPAEEDELAPTEMPEEEQQETRQSRS